MPWEAIPENPAGVSGNFKGGIGKGRLCLIWCGLTPPWTKDLPCEDNANHCHGGCRHEEHQSASLRIAEGSYKEPAKTSRHNQLGLFQNQR